MEPYKIKLTKMVKRGDGYAVQTADMPKDERTWTGMVAFVPGDIESIRKVVISTRTSFRAAVLDAPGGAWVHAGHNDLLKLVEALQGRKTDGP